MIPVIVLLVLCLSVPVFAVELPRSVVRDGDTYLETFLVKGSYQEHIDFWKEWQQSDRNILGFMYDGFYYFIVVPDGATVSVSTRDAATHRLNLVISKVSTCIRFSPSVDENGTFEFSEYYTVSANTPYVLNGIAAGTYFNTTGYTLPALSWDYIGEFIGNLAIVDDLGDDDGGGLLDGLLDFFSNIWDWLTSFWDSFKNALLSLFVPSNGYFTNWFSEIKAAFEAKTGGITGVFEHIADSLDTLKSGSVSESSVILKTNDNYLFSGYKGISVDLLAHAKPLLQFLRNVFNGILVIVTVITCYKQLIKTMKS